MFETNQFKLPLLQASQSQKHVTMNEAIARLDAISQLRLISISQVQPPVELIDGQCFSVPVGAQDEWEGNENELAIFANGGWVFLTPKIGWRAWVEDQSIEAIFDGTDWIIQNVQTLSVQGDWGTSTQFTIIEHEQVLNAGAETQTPNLIPDNSYVMSVTTRNTEDLVTDGATSWKLGLTWDDAKYGSGRDLGLNSTNDTDIAQKQLYYRTANKLVLKPESGNFVSGRVRIALHCIVFNGPDPV